MRKSSQGRNPSLNGKRKSSNEHGFFVAVTSLSKIGEGRIQDLTGDVLFPVTFKCAILTGTRKDPRHYWFIMFNEVLMLKSPRGGVNR